MILYIYILYYIILYYIILYYIILLCYVMLCYIILYLYYIIYPFFIAFNHPGVSSTLRRPGEVDHFLIGASRHRILSDTTNIIRSSNAISRVYPYIYIYTSSIVEHGNPIIRYPCHGGLYLPKKMPAAPFTSAFGRDARKQQRRIR